MTIDTDSPRPTMDVLLAVIREYAVDPSWLLTGDYDSATHRRTMDSDRTEIIEVVKDVALNCPSSDEYIRVPVTKWIELAREHAKTPADGFFLSCTNTTQIEAIADIERALGKPVVNSNQAVLFGCVKRLKSALAPLPPMPALGRLMQHLGG